MLFNSVSFLVFFPVVALFYFVLPHKYRWVWLLLASYYFYMSWNPRYAILIAISTVITYLSGILIDYSNKLGAEKKRQFQKKLWVALSFTANLAILFFFKYFDFALDNINSVLSAIGIQQATPGFDIILPVGISFYTFQALSYTMDIYRGEIKVERNPARYALFVSFFPQLVAGPIERSKNLLVQVREEHHFDYKRIKDGLLLMAWGFFQKLLVADKLAPIVNAIYDNHADYSGIFILAATVLFAIQIFCDFSAYSDIAIGAAQVMGFKLMQNFRQPYFALSIRDFWQRWHISLSTWFRDYLYIPMGGNRCSKTRRYFNLMATFLVSGLWHGASWNFIAWGGLHGVYQIIGDMTKPLKQKVQSSLKYDAVPAITLCRGAITFMLVCIAWIFFRAPNLTQALEMVGSIFLRLEFAAIFDKYAYFPMGFNMQEMIMPAIAVAALIIINIIQRKVVIRDVLAKQHFIVRWISYYIILAILLYGFMYTPQQQFMYFQF